MRGYVPAYNVVVPSSLVEALYLIESEHLVPMAGGTDLMVVLASGRMAPVDFVSLAELSELSGITTTPDSIRLGALTRYYEVLSNPILQAEFPSLIEAARGTGAVAIQNRGTLGGNIANASPAADSPPALVTYDAQIELVSAAGTRTIAYADFHLGYKRTRREAHELIGAVILPRHAGIEQHYYRKVGTRKAQAISKVCLAGTSGRGGIRLGLGSVAPAVASCPETCAWLSSLPRVPLPRVELEARMAAEIAPIDDVRSNRDYRFQVAVNLVEDFWSQLCPS